MTARRESSSDNTIDAAWLRRFRRQLSRWYASHARDLPWRRTHDPYAIWISEIMLQQTTVAAVVPFFERFLKRFPDVGTLARAAERSVLRQWEGLGYYSRARNLHRAAKIIAVEHQGQLPHTAAELVELPGIGRYTAGAIASFAFDQNEPIVEANTLRLYSRLLGYAGDPHSAAGQRLLWEFAERILPRRHPGRFNQALIELGATVCTPVDPDCSRCPVRSCCRSAADGTQHDIPRMRGRPAVTHVCEAAVAIRDGSNLLLRRCGPKERWAGLWDFVRFEIPQMPTDPNITISLTANLKRRLRQKIFEKTQATITGVRQITEIRHSVTRYRIRLLCFAAELTAGGPDASPDFRWLPVDDLKRWPLSVTAREFASKLAHDVESGRNSSGGELPRARA